MASEKLSQAVQLIKSGNKVAALPILKEVVQAEPNNENAWLWLYSCVGNVEQKKYCLQQALRINSNNQKASEALYKLENPIPPKIHSNKQVGNSGIFCPHCQSSQVFQRSKIVNNMGNAVGVGCASGLITFLLLTFYAAYLIANDNPYDFGDSSFFVPGSDMPQFIVAVVIGILASIITFFASRKTVIYYECLNCKSTW